MKAMKMTITAVLVLAVAGFASLAGGAAISVNLTETNTANDIGAAETAGAPGYADDNWNNIDWLQFGSATALDDGGGTETTVTVNGYVGTMNGNWTGNWTTGGATPSWVTAGAQGTANGKLFSAGYKRAKQDVEDTTNVTISNITDYFVGEYTLVVYYGGLPGDTAWNNPTVTGGHSYYTVDGEIRIRDGDDGNAMLYYTDFRSIGYGGKAPYDQKFDGTFLAQTVIDHNMGDPAGATHQVFTGLTTDTLVLNVNAAQGRGLDPETRKGGGGIGGFQLIGTSIPEPATMALLAMGAGALILRRRRRKA